MGAAGRVVVGVVDVGGALVGVDEAGMAEEEEEVDDSERADDWSAGVEVG